jgi:L-asparaginase / beta-aspartyl-peptidase
MSNCRSSSNEKLPLLPTPSKKGKFALVIHGGAGIMFKENSNPEKEAQYKNMLSASLRAGYEVLNDGGQAMDAAVAAVSVMEGLILAKI